MLKAAVGFVLVISAAFAGAAQTSQPLYGPRGVSPIAVRQGELGSCYFHASIAALALAEPDTLRAAIRKNFPVGYKVHFASGPDEAVYPDDIKYGRVHGFDQSDGDWVLVLMRAYAQREVRESLVDSIERSKVIPSIAKTLSLKWLNETDLMLVAYDRAIRSVIKQDGMMDRQSLKSHLAGELSKIGVPATESRMLVGFLDEEGFFAAIASTVQQNGEVFGAYKSFGQGGIPSRVLAAFAGSAGAASVNNQQAVLNEMRRVHGGGVALVAGSPATPPYAQLANSSWWVPGHAYTVMDYDDGSGTVTLRNPWGEHPRPDGTFTLPFTEFAQTFEFVSYSERR